MKPRHLIPLAVLAFVCATSQAQNGCVNSPESPTALLAVIGGAGGFIAALRSRYRR